VGADFSQSRMATSLWPKSMTRFQKIGSVGTVVDGFEDHVHDLLDHFVPDAGNTELAHLAVGLRNELLPNGAKAKVFGSHFLNDLADGRKRKAIERPFVRSRARTKIRAKVCSKAFCYTLMKHDSSRI
jgi:hypothetical protein